MKLLRGMLGSIVIHTLLFGAALGLVALRNANASNSIDIDLVGSSLLFRPHNAGGHPTIATAPEAWYLGDRPAARPKAPSQPLTAQPEPEGVACPPPCPTNAGDWLPAAAASRQPEWTDGLISAEDYPPQLRAKGIEGKVIVDLLIDAAGRVRSVSLVQGADPAFDQVALTRLKASLFRPAYDGDGNAVACRLRLPIRFSLRY